MAPTPAYLFRVWFPTESHGTNTSAHFAPGSIGKAHSNTSSNSSKSTPITPDELLNAFLGRRNYSNRFVYFTQSLLYALQFAAQKKYRDGWSNVNMTCNNTSTCKDNNGQAIVFHHAPDLIQQYSIPFRTNREGERRTYSDEYLVIGCVIHLGAGSSTANFDDLIRRGLHTLVPEMGEEATAPKGAQLHQAVRRLREYCFGQGKMFSLRSADVDLAMGLSRAFAPVSGSPSSKAAFYDVHMLACHYEDGALMTLN